MPDLRLPIGVFFCLAGLILLCAAFTSSSPAPLGTQNVNLYCGVVTLGFGSVMLWLARRAS